LNKILLVAVLVLSAIAQVVAEEATIKPLVVEKVVYIDVRTWVEHKVDHIDGDTRIHVSDIVSGVEAQFPDKNTLIKLYCERGVRAETALQKLIAAGYLNVKNVGGIDAVRESRFAGLRAD
jgi:phage shock protein E